MNNIANSMKKGLEKYVIDVLTEDFNNKIYSYDAYDEILIWTIQDYLSSCEPSKEDIEYLRKINLLELIEDEF